MPIQYGAGRATQNASRSHVANACKSPYPAAYMNYDKLNETFITIPIDPYGAARATNAE